MNAPVSSSTLTRWVAGLALVALMGLLAVAMQEVGEKLAAGGGTLVAPAHAAPARAARTPILDNLSCFECHNRARYDKGEKFSHKDHEDAGHCHTCHAFTPHFSWSIRKKSCLDCHEPEALEGFEL
ncbi:MAG: cytochrome c3 family protein [Deltaproteobacteria bacterium]|nr:cytochrome c3 family protein [Deltaproteobacteria bacterium]